MPRPLKYPKETIVLAKQMYKSKEFTLVAICKTLNIKIRALRYHLFPTFRQRTKKCTANWVKNNKERVMKKQIEYNNRRKAKKTNQ